MKVKNVYTHVQDPEMEKRGRNDGEVRLGIVI